MNDYKRAIKELSNLEKMSTVDLQRVLFHVAAEDPQTFLKGLWAITHPAWEDKMLSLHHRSFVDAIKNVRAESGMGLKEAKEWVEVHEHQMSFANPRPGKRTSREILSSWGDSNKDDPYWAEKAQERAFEDQRDEIPF
jgi:ribosomal protein L7/L12